MTHSILPPSSAAIWGAPGGCTGWVQMNQTYPEIETDASREGTAAHEVASRLLSSAARGNCDPVQEGELLPNNVVVTAEMLESADLYVDDARAVMLASNIFGGALLGIEQQIQIPDIHPQCFGTPDLYLFDAKNKTLYIWDYKYGYEAVEAFENWQLIAYAAGILGHIAKFTPLLRDRFEPDLEVVFRIVQPRAMHRDGPIREWRVAFADLAPYWGHLRAGALTALAPTSAQQSGPHCKYCPGRHACPAAMTAGARLFEAATVGLPVDLSVEATAVQLQIITRARKQLEALESGFEQQVEHLIRSGSHVPGFKMEQSFGREKWATAPEEVMALGDLLGFELRKPALVTPKQAIKLGVDASVIMAYTEKTKGAMRVVPDNLNHAKKVFSK